MLRDHVDHVYLITLQGREKDRLLPSLQACAEIGLPAKAWPAINGYQMGIQAKPYPGMDPHHWNSGAAALVLTTAQILRHAKANKFKRILILEDDIDFNIVLNDVKFKPVINRIADTVMPLLPSDWHMLQFGSQHIFDPKPIVKNLLYQIQSAFCLHCYMVHETIYDYYLDLCLKCEKQLDFITADDIQPIGKCFCTPNVAFQRKTFSSIELREVTRDFLRE